MTASAVAGRLALKLWLASMLCWWVAGIQFSRLWWLVDDRQLDWILFCYAWEVPVLGWTGAVLLPWLRLRRIAARLPEDGTLGMRRLARYPIFVFWAVLITSTVGYAVGALQVDYFAALPTLEVAKIMIQGPTLGGLFAVAAYLLAERAVQDLAIPVPSPAEPRRRVAESLYRKVFSIAVAVTLGVLVGAMLLVSVSEPLPGEVARWYLDHSLPRGHGANVVNVILVDFRALDTLGEILVIATAALGAWALLRAARPHRPRSEKPR